ncbi:hypothetical protein GCM10010191_16670 [Actinomadura vinacea]|uniref:SecA family profile domain-containing protein n=1 Tax=Actinomadura vinacea TaxID=115336 RepID=A0ABP5VPS7_9ACTN
MAAAAVGRWTGRFAGRKALNICRETAGEVTAAEPGFRALSDAELGARTEAFRARLAAGEDAFDLMIDAFAAVREAARRTLGLRHHDEQIMGGTAMALGMIADMRDHEGKTLACVLPAYLAALEGGAVHVINADDREAERAAGWMGPVYRALGIEVGLLRPEPEAYTARRAVYAADVVYGSVSQIGYDLLRGDMAWSPDEVVQRGLDVGIVDDARNLFIENRDLEMLISGPAPEEEVERRTAWAGIAESLSREAGDYSFDRSTRRVRLLEPGIGRLQDLLGVDELHPVEDAVGLGLVADVLAARESGEEAPGPDRQVRLARITVAGLLSAYGSLSGASADAACDHEVFQRGHALTVVTIPSRRPVDEPGRRVLDPERFERRADLERALDLQRAEWAAERAAIMSGEGRTARIDGLFDEFAEQAVLGLPRSCGRDDLDAVLALVGEVCPISVTVDELMRTPKRAAVAGRLRAAIAEAYGRRERELGSELLREVEHHVLLSVLDLVWREHLAREDALPASLWLLGDDPNETFVDAVVGSYVLMEETIPRETVGYLFNLEVEIETDEADGA